MIESCKHGALISKNILNHLHSNQGGTGRHRCPNCAYQLGFNLGSSQKYNTYQEFISKVDSNLETCPNNTIVPTIYLIISGDNQGGAGRHKCCNCAFAKGFDDGLSFIQESVNNKKSDEIYKLLKFQKPKIDIVQKASNNRKSIKNFDFEGNNNQLKLIGDIGEDIILKYEQEKKYNFKKNVRNVAKEIGDGIGYDILSYDSNGKEKYIEVKSTISDIKTPFYISLNEKNFLFNNENTFIYRVFNLSLKNKTANFFVLSKRDILKLNYLPQTFKVTFK